MKAGNGELTGEFKEAAQRLIGSYIPPESAEDRYQSLLQHMDDAAAAGLTSVQDAATSLDNFPVFERAVAAGALKLRFRFAPLILPKRRRCSNPFARAGGAPRNHKLEKPLTEADLAQYRELRTHIRGRC